MVEDEDIIGEEEDDDGEGIEAAPVPDKWKKLEADLKKIRERSSKREELQ